jgi:hypothetical protein
MLVRHIEFGQYVEVVKVFAKCKQMGLTNKDVNAKH